jgi:hypothetical protein
MPSDGKSGDGHPAGGGGRKQRVLMKIEKNESCHEAEENEAIRQRDAKPIGKRRYHEPCAANKIISKRENIPSRQKAA